MGDSALMRRGEATVGVLALSLKNGQKTVRSPSGAVWTQEEQDMNELAVPPGGARGAVIILSSLSSRELRQEIRLRQCARKGEWDIGFKELCAEHWRRRYIEEGQ